MFLTNIHFGWDVNIVEFINNFTQDAHLSTLFKLISYLGTEYVVIVIFGLLYWGLNKRMAKEMGYATFYGMVTNNLLKSFFNFLRPFQERPESIKCLDESILLVDKNGNHVLSESGTYYLSSSSSFPSGHSQGSSSIYNSFAKSSNKKWVWIISSVLCALVMLSRMALGVHSFLDVLTGYLVGICVIEVIYFVRKKMKNEMILHISILSVFGILTLLSPLWSSQTRDLFTTFGIALGMVIGFYIEEKYINFEGVKTWWKVALRLVFGVAIILLCKIVLKLPYQYFVNEGSYLGNVLDMLRYFIMIVVGTTLYPMLIKKIPFLNEKEAPEEYREA